MIENYYIYVVKQHSIPHLSDSSAKRDKVSSEWESVDVYNGTYETPTPGYVDFKKKISSGCHEWDVVIRKYEIINSSIIIIKSLDPTYTEESLEQGLKNSDEVFKESIVQSGLAGISPIEPIILSFFGVNEDFNKGDLQYIFFEKNGESKILCLNRFRYFLKIDTDFRLSNAIKDNIITLLSLSEISLSFSLKFLKDDEGKKRDLVNEIKTIWGHKFFLLRCPAILLFPKFFEIEISVIDNLLDCRNMDLSENQSNLLDEIKVLSNNQSGLLNQIHKAERGILILTTFIIIDIGYRILKESLMLYPIFALALAISIAFILLQMMEITSIEAWKRYLDALSKLRGH